jgi:hypothetical protein
MRVRARAVGGLAGLVVWCLALGPAAVAEADARKLLTVQGQEITEASGLAASVRHRGVLYTHNDSGGTPRIFAIGPDGATRATFTVAGAQARDWEGMAIGRDEQGRPALFVADIGDNLGGAWPFVTVYRVPEPTRLRDQTLRATAFRLKYKDGPRNAEAVLINPRSNQLYVASKLFSGSLYRAPLRLRTDRYNVLTKVADAPPLATDGAFAPDGRTYVLRTYFSAHIYSLSTGKQLDSLSLPQQEQGESITYAPDGQSLLAGSEGVQQPIWQIPLPEKVRPKPTGTTSSPTDPASPTAGSRDEQPKSRTGLFIAAGIAVAVGYGFLRRRRS